MERADIALSRKPKGWLEYEYYVPQQIRDWETEALQKLADADAAELAQAAAEILAAEEAEAERKAAEDDAFQANKTAVESDIAKLKEEVQAGAYRMGMLV